MSADFDFFQRIPYEQYLQKRDDIDSRIKLSDLASISWQMSGRFPLRTARYGVIQAGFFSYWADSFIAELETDTVPPQIEN